jgi:ribosome recycling factor
LAKSKFEDARISVRALRDDAMKAIEKSEKAGDIGEDDKFTKKEAVQSAVDEVNQSLESLFTQKESELKA